MKNIFRYFVIAVIFSGFAACTDPVDEPDTVQILLEADKDALVADGADKVTFTVTADGKDVTFRSKITVDGVAISGNAFSTGTPGRYAFKAVCDGSESNTVVIEAEPVKEIVSQFVKNVAVFDKHHIFTHTELKSRFEISLENYCKTLNMESLTMIDMAYKEILPAVSKYTNLLCNTVVAENRPALGISSPVRKPLPSSCLTCRQMPTINCVIWKTAVSSRP